MNREDFERLVAEEFPNAVPEKFRTLLTNVEFLVEDEPSAEVRKEQGLAEGDTLLGLYTGIALPDRGEYYGLGETYPDTIVLYKNPIEEEAERMGGREADTRTVIRETIWHEVAHHFGYDDEQVEERESRKGGEH